MSFVGAPTESIEREDSPEALLRRMRAGDRAAAARFMALYGALIRSRVRDKLSVGLRRVMDSEDVLSTVARRLDGMVLEGRLRAETEPELWSLVQTVARNALSESLRSTRGDRVVMGRGDRAHGADTPPLHGGSERTLVGAAMDALPDETDKRVLSMWLRGASHAHIARSLGSTPAAVRMRWARLMRALRSLGRGNEP